VHLILPIIIAVASLTAPPVHAQVSPIVSGEHEDEHDAVVGLGMDIGEIRFIACTGTLITPRLVLSAGHCGGDLDLDFIVDNASAYFGRSADDVDEAIGFVDAWIHPDKRGLAFDFGLIELERDAIAAPTALWSDSIDETLEGTEVQVVGWGLDGVDKSTGGTKRSATLIVDRVSELYLITQEETNPDGALPCDGDSGGPLYVRSGVAWRQVAVHTWGEDPCGDRSGSSRIDLARDWIGSVVAEVHGTEDLCAAKEMYGDGVCDRSCPEPDSDCVADEEEDTAPKGCACAHGGAFVPGSWAAISLLLVARRRRVR
jgi:V8-like Glu-specific endopeptidase